MYARTPDLFDGLESKYFTVMLEYTTAHEHIHYTYIDIM